MKIDVAGSYSVSATDGSLAPTGTSDNFAVSPAVAARLVIHTQPSATAIAGQAFAIQPAVYEEDRFGNLETGDNSTMVTASASGGTGTLQGTTTATVSGGVATFANLGDDTAETISLAVQERRARPGDLERDRRHSGSGHATRGDDPATGSSCAPAKRSRWPSLPRILTVMWTRPSTAM